MGIDPVQLLIAESPGQHSSPNVASVVISRDARWALRASTADYLSPRVGPTCGTSTRPTPPSSWRVPGHELPLSEAVLSPDNRRLVTASQDSTARVWDLDVLSISAQPVRISSSIDGDGFPFPPRL